MMHGRLWAFIISIVATPFGTPEMLFGYQMGQLAFIQASGQTVSLDDATLWAEFEKWAAVQPHLPPGQNVRWDERYVAWLVAQGVSKEQAQARVQRLDISRRGSPARERVIWNVLFKHGGGPDQPLRLLQETVQDIKPGRALEPGMGRGRNSIYLASIGWDVTGYDLAPDALQAAQNYAKQSGVSIKTIEASHDVFDFGSEQWDLILIAYSYIDPLDPTWPARLWRALKPGGLIVCQTIYGFATGIKDPNRVAPTIISNWAQFRVLRFEHLDAKSDDWMQNAPFVRMVLRKQP